VQIGFIGSGNIARALAVGWGDPALFTDGGSGRAAALAAEVGGEAVASNRELAERADVVVLAHKPYQLEAVAEQIAGATKVAVTLLARTPQAAVRALLPGAAVFRVEPNTPSELGCGVLAFAVPDAPADEQLVAELHALFGRLGTVVDVPEHLMPVAGATAGVGPAYVALLAEAWIDSAVRRGLSPEVASTLVTETLAGSAALLRALDHDTLRLRRAVASPGGSTARGLAALERGGVRAALAQAMDDVVDA